MLTIDIPVSRAVKNFLTFKYGKVFQLNQNEWLGIIICSILNRKKDYYEPFDSADKGYTYSISMNFSQYNKLGIGIEEHKKNALSKALEKIFREYIFEKAVMDKRMYGIQYKDTMINTLEFYGVEDCDGYYEAIRRDFARKKVKIYSKTAPKIWK